MVGDADPRSVIKSLIRLADDARAIGNIELCNTYTEASMRVGLRIAWDKVAEIERGMRERYEIERRWAGEK